MKPIPPIHTQWLGENIHYTEALQLQKKIHARTIEDTQSEQILLLEHSPVFTIGRTKNQSSLQKKSTLPYPIIQINRGGEGTYHGPGQLVSYPILDLRQRTKDLHLYLRTLENSLIETCQLYKVEAFQKDGLTGVWVNNKKIASIGVGVKNWVTMHGIAINITPESLPPFQHIIPCGISGVQMTCLWNETNHRPTTQDFGTQFSKILSKNVATAPQQPISATGGNTSQS